MMQDEWEFLKINLRWDLDGNLQRVKSWDNQGAGREITARLKGSRNPDLLEFFIEAHRLGWEMETVGSKTAMLRRRM